MYVEFESPDSFYQVSRRWSERVSKKAPISEVRYQVHSGMNCMISVLLVTQRELSWGEWHQEWDSPLPSDNKVLSNAWNCLRMQSNAVSFRVMLVTKK